MCVIPMYLACTSSLWGSESVTVDLTVYSSHMYKVFVVKSNVSLVSLTSRQDVVLVGNRKSQKPSSSLIKPYHLSVKFTPHSNRLFANQSGLKLSTHPDYKFACTFKHINTTEGSNGVNLFQNKSDFNLLQIKVIGF